VYPAPTWHLQLATDVERIRDRAAQAEEDRTALQQQVQGLEARLAEERDVVHRLQGEVVDLQGKLRTCKGVMLLLLHARSRSLNGLWVSRCVHQSCASATLFPPTQPTPHTHTLRPSF
jgi:hypothetical protein